MSRPRPGGPDRENSRDTLRRAGNRSAPELRQHGPTGCAAIGAFLLDPDQVQGVGRSSVRPLYRNSHASHIAARSGRYVIRTPDVAAVNHLPIAALKCKLA